MLRRVVAIALLLWQETVRSKLFPLLACALLCLAAGLPFSLKGDGTITGLAQVQLAYTLGLLLLFLGSVTLWIACGAVAQEVEEKTIQLLAVKPLHRGEIWLGKWLGLLLVNFMLLTSSGAVALLSMHVQFRQFPATEQDRDRLQDTVLTGRLLVEPHEECFFDEARARLNVRLQRQPLPDGLSEQDVLREIHRDLVARSLAVHAGEQKVWLFSLPRALRHSRESMISLRFRLTSAVGRRGGVSGRWVLRVPGTIEPLEQIRVDNVHEGRLLYEVPLDKIRDLPQLEVVFENDAADRSTTAVFDAVEGAQMLVRASGFTLNYVRSLVVLLLKLGLLAALGVSAGTCFSLPVATFLTISTVVIVFLTQYFVEEHSDVFGPAQGHHHHHHAHEEEEEEQMVLHVIEVTAAAVLRGIYALIRPISQEAPLQQLSDGVLVSGGRFGRVVGSYLILYPLILGGLSSWILSRRELALPAR